MNNVQHTWETFWNPFADYFEKDYETSLFWRFLSTDGYGELDIFDGLEPAKEGCF